MIILPFTTRILKKDFKGKLTILPYGKLVMNGYRVHGQPLRIWKKALIQGCTPEIIMDNGSYLKDSFKKKGINGGKIK